MLNFTLLILGSQSMVFENAEKWAVIVARYVIYMLMIKGSQEACALAHDALRAGHQLHLRSVWRRSRAYAALVVLSSATMLYYKQRVLGEDFLFMFIGYLITKYPEMEEKSPIINYGVGMAYSFFEGYLVHIIPSDGANFVGFEENINIYEARQGVVFPVKRLFIVITKSLYCPPDLKEFNKKRKDLPFLEACQSLEEVEKDVAGVKNRAYRNSAYKIRRPQRPGVFVAAECATPLHTLHRALQKTALYEELAGVEPEGLVRDFCATLRTVIQQNPESRDKCELLFYDDSDPNQNLADVILDRIRELEPDFESIIAHTD